MRRSFRLLYLVLSGLAISSCGGGGDGGGGPDDQVPSSMAVQAGNGQQALKGTALPIDPAVIVRDQNNQPMSGVAVEFAVTGGGGSVTGASATTNAQGVATVGSWTLGPNAGPNTLSASVPGSGISAVNFTATATDVAPTRKWTVMVFMAADNNLAIDGIFDIDEMEAAGTAPDVSVVVQAEFSPSTLGQQGCGAACFNRPNFNTFRYLVSSNGPHVTGPDGAATDLGNRDMTDPAQIKEFVLWAKQNYPAEHYALVLWNHGGGYTGLLQDETTAGSNLMSIGELPAALNGVGAIDILDFDMCLMAGYETLVQIDGLVDYAVFSEEVVPGEGNPYQAIIDAIQANATASPRVVAGQFVSAFNTAYQANRASTTKSAYELSGFAAFETALDAVALRLRTNLNTMGAGLGTAVTQSQKYTFPQLTDLVDLLDNIKANIADAQLGTEVDALKALAIGSFRVANAARNGTATDAPDVTNSTGLNIVIPSGVGNDQLAATGPQSLASYQALYPGKEWTLLLTSFLTGQGTVGQVDQGNNRFEAYLVWDPNAVNATADVDFWILEPNGNLYLPYIGSVTPNGTLSNDSYAGPTYFEGYLTNRFIEAGTYKFYANLWRDPQDFRPEYDLSYRTDQTSQFSSLFSPNFPVLSTQVSWLSDPTPTFGEIEAGDYTDLQYIAFATFPSPPAGSVTVLARSNGAGPAARAGNQITPEQLAAARRLVQQRTAGIRP